MTAYNPVETLASALYRALAVDLLPIQYYARSVRQKQTHDPILKERRPTIEDVEVYHFPQTWSSTSLGFGGIGGQAITDAYTTVIVCKGSACVYFGGQFAYSILKYNGQFMDDIRNHRINECGKQQQYEQ